MWLLCVFFFFKVKSVFIYSSISYFQNTGVVVKILHNNNNQYTGMTISAMNSDMCVVCGADLHWSTTV